MASYNDEQRGTSQSLLGSLINPVTNLKTQYFSAWAIPTYMGMAHSGKLGIGLLYSTGQMIPGMMNYANWGGNYKQKAAAAVFKMVEFPGTHGVAQNLATAIGDTSPESMARITSGLSTFIRGRRFSFGGFGGTWQRDAYKILRSAGVGGMRREIMPALAAGSRSLVASSVISGIGAVMSPIAWGMLVGEGVAHLAGLAFKGAVTAMDYVAAQTEHVRSLEFGGSLSAGFRSGAAATERQRCVKELQRTPLAGRRFMGQEANLYSSLI